MDQPTGAGRFGSGSGNNTNSGTAVLVMLVVLAMLTFIFAVTSVVLVTLNRNLATQIMHLQQGAPESSVVQNQTLTGVTWTLP
jgi:preprotein translocase subunit SecG